MVTVMGCRIVLLSLLAASLGSDEELYSTHLYSSYLQHNLPPSNSVEFGGPNTKREVKFSKSGLFYHDGPYVSHPQAERAASPLEIESYVTPLPETLQEGAQTPTTTPNPYTYSVTGGSVTPISHYHGSPTPSPYHGSPTPSPYHWSPTPSPYHRSPAPFYGSSTPYYESRASPVYHAQTTPSPFHSRTTPNPYKAPYVPSHPGTKVSPHTLVPTHALRQIPYTPKSTHYHKASHYSPKIEPFSLVEGPLPALHHPPRAAQQSPTAQPFLSPVHPTPFSFNPLPNPPQHTGLAISPRPALRLKVQDTKPSILFPTSNTKPAITFQDYVEQELVDNEYQDYNEEENKPDNFSPVFQQKPRAGKQLAQLPGSHQQFSPQPIFSSQPSNTPSQQQGFQPKHQQQKSFQSQPQQFPSQNQQFQLRPQQLQQQQFQPQQQQFQPQQQQQFQPQQQQQFQPQQQQFQPQQQQFQPQEQQQQLFEPQAEIEQTETLFSSINKAATDREPRRQLTNPSSMKHMSRNDALARLMDIAGSDWDLSHSIQENLVGGPEKSDYDCPAPEGHFPDTKKCNVYYQCANGISTRHSCGAGLKYNVLTNQCDWAASVDCSLNSDPRMLNQHSGPTPRPQVSENFQQPFTATQDSFQLQQQQFQPQGQQFQQQEQQFQPREQQFQQQQQQQPFFSL